MFSYDMILCGCGWVVVFIVNCQLPSEPPVSQLHTLNNPTRINAAEHVKLTHPHIHQ